MESPAMIPGLNVSDAAALSNTAYIIKSLDDILRIQIQAVSLVRAVYDRPMTFKAKHRGWS
jgi:hypothetical protein